ncbi:MAG: hypothetical protein WKF35_13760 [Ferruginibacter sp.]
MKTKFTTLCGCLLLFIQVQAQTYRLDWNNSFSPAWSAGSTSRTANNVGSSGINITTTFTNSAASSTWEQNTPDVGNVGTLGWTLPGITGTNSMVLWVDWINTQQKVRAVITFSSPVANPSFYVGDLDKSNSTVTDSDNYLDRVTVTGTTPDAAIIPSTVTKFNASSTIINISGNAAFANNIVNQGGNASTDAASGAAQDGTALYTITGTVSSITLDWDNLNNTNTVVNPSGQAVNLGDINFNKTISVSGTVFNDVNGNMLINGSETGIEPVTLFVNAIDVSTGKIIGVASVNSNGTYTFPNISTNSNVDIRLSTTAGVQGSTTVPAVAAISGYANTTPLTVNVVTATSNITGQNFGLDQLPVPVNSSLPPQTNPGGTVKVTIPSSYFSATDPDGGTISSIRITTFPSNATSLTVNGITYTSGTFPGAGITIPTNTTGQPTLPVSIDPVDGLVTAVISYRATDNAGKESAVIAGVSVVFSSILPLRLLSFTGSYSDGKILLNWLTENEINVKEFSIQKSKDGILFETVFTQTARNRTTITEQYSYRKTDLLSGSVFYRLQLIDLDGSSSFSPIIIISFNENSIDKVTGLRIESNNSINFKFTTVNAQYIDTRIIDINGRIIHKVRKKVVSGLNDVFIPLKSHLTESVYFLSIINSNGFKILTPFLKRND